LKANGVSWNAPSKFWTRLVSESDLEEMKTFLTDEIYPQGKIASKFAQINLRDRFKA